ncbi:hypothetical protein MU582_21810 [Nocardioidaceae bacterium SCSIO 66511]|nr:hypothetical protein MU582_21810 [Nocardioidaceae bacterium SCSIO 66511]
MSGIADLGAHGRPHPWWTPLRVVLAIGAVTFTLSLVVKAPCAAGAWWDSPNDYAKACHTPLVNDYAFSGLAERVAPWDASADQHVVRPEQTVPDAAMSYAAAVVAQGVTGDADIDERRSAPVVDIAKDAEVRHESVVYIGVVAVVQLLAFLIGLRCLVLARPRRPYAMVAMASAPVLLFTTVLGWDLIPIALVCGAWLAWSRRRATVAGVLLGLAGAMAFWPLLILPALALAGVRGDSLDVAGRAIGGAVVAWVCAVIPLVVVSGGAYFDPISAYVDLDLGAGSIWDIAADLGVTPSSDALNVALLIGMLIVVGGVATFALKAYRSPDAPTLALLLVLGWFVLTKTYEPQYALVLLPLAAYAWPRWRDLLWWQGAEILFVLGTWWHEAGFTMDSGDVDRVYPALILIRVAAQLWLAARIMLDHRFASDDPSVELDPVERRDREPNVDRDVVTDLRRSDR